jgi:hypothetical protein
MVAALAMVLLLVAPFSSSVSVSTEIGGRWRPLTEVRDSSTLLEGNGPRVIGLLLFPVGVAAVGLFRRKDVRVMSAIFLWAFCFVAMYSIGLFFVPAAALMAVAAIRTPRKTDLP